jgi:hypothetical protein
MMKSITVCTALLVAPSLVPHGEVIGQNSAALQSETSFSTVGAGIGINDFHLRDIKCFT